MRNCMKTPDLEYDDWIGPITASWEMHSNTCRYILEKTTHCNNSISVCIRYSLSKFFWLTSSGRLFSSSDSLKPNNQNYLQILSRNKTGLRSRTLVTHGCLSNGTLRISACDGQQAPYVRPIKGNIMTPSTGLRLRLGLQSILVNLS